jgi:ribonuclease-3
METIEENLGYSFKDPALLTQALTTKALANEERQQGRRHVDHELLTALGDAVFKTVFIELRIHAHYPTRVALIPGKLQMEHEAALVDVAGQMGIARSIRLSTGERSQGVVEKGPEILAETMKTIIGAVYLDGGFEPAKEAIIRFRPHLDE